MLFSKTISVSQLFSFVSFHPPLPQPLTDKEKAWDIVLDKSCLEVASEVQNT